VLTQVQEGVLDSPVPTHVKVSIVSFTDKFFICSCNAIIKSYSCWEMMTNNIQV